MTKNIYSHVGNTDLLKRLNKTDHQRFPFQNNQWMLDIIQFIKQIFALWIFFLLMVAGVVIDLFGKLFTFLWRFISWKTDSFFYGLGSYMIAVKIKRDDSSQELKMVPGIL